MKVSDLVKELNLTVFCGEAGLDAEISGGYTSDLRSNTQGRGQYAMEPHSYQEVPKNIAEKIMTDRKK